MTCIIVDDEPLAREGMASYVRDTHFLLLKATCENPVELMQLLQKEPVDLIFLDIHMPKMSGIDFLKITPRPPMVIITTAFPDYALDGFRFSVLDYLLKPIRLPRFLQAVQKAVKEIEEASDEKNNITDASDYVFVKTESKGKLLKINLNEIDYIEGMKNYVAIYCGEKKTLVYTSMKDLEERLSKKQFIRVHKSFIIPIGKITGIEGNLLRLKNVAAEILIGENYKPDLMDIIRNKMIQ